MRKRWQTVLHLLSLLEAISARSTLINAIFILSDSFSGSRTALLPYTRGRYFENHKLLSVTDKLHKLYSTTSPPLVWARSVGLEVVNELDSIKAALMISAGASSTASRSLGSTASYTAGRAVEVASGAVDAAGMLGRVFAGLSKAGFDRALDSFGRNDARR